MQTQLSRSAHSGNPGLHADAQIAMSEHVSNEVALSMDCLLCGTEMKPFGVGGYRVAPNTFEKTNFGYCSDCDLFSRLIPPELLERHLDAASYVQPENEDAFRHRRSPFFEWLLGVFDQHLGPGSRSLLDVGCGYGHLLELARERGYAAQGVERNSALAVHLRERGFTIWATVDNVDREYDAIALIDSLYYFSDPVRILRRCRELLNPNGLLLLRITNRNWLARLPMLGVDNLGDATHNYSLRSLSVLLEKSGWRIDRVINRERGKRQDWKRSAFYLITSLVSTVTCGRCFISPGLVALARPVE